MSIQDRDWYHDHHRQLESRRSASGYLAERPVPLWLQIAAGVFLGSTAAALITWQVMQWRAEQAAARIAEEAEIAFRQAAAETRQANLRQAQVIEARERARRAELAARQQADERLRRDASAERSRRESAWDRYYRKPAACDDAKGGSWSVECANDFMRAKRRFAELYDAGRL